MLEEAAAGEVFAAGHFERGNDKDLPILHLNARPVAVHVQTGPADGLS